eukprot:3258414-Rhodomonas_salina.1
MTADERNSAILDDTDTKDDRESTWGDMGMMHGAAGKQGKGAHIHSADAVETGTADECGPAQIRMAGGNRRTSWSTPLHSVSGGADWEERLVDANSGRQRAQKPNRRKHKQAATMPKNQYP